jgi:hypothetical protein
MKKLFLILAGITLLFLSACQNQSTVCPQVPGTPQFINVFPDELPTLVAVINSTLIPVEIGGKIIQVNKIVEGPLCNDTWSGTVYVTCDVQVYPWAELPTFLKDCNLSIAPDTVVYVAEHNDTAYYNGCSCHTGENTGP